MALLLPLHLSSYNYYSFFFDPQIYFFIVLLIYPHRREPNDMQLAWIEHQSIDLRVALFCTICWIYVLLFSFLLLLLHLNLTVCVLENIVLYISIFNITQICRYVQCTLKIIFDINYLRKRKKWFYLYQAKEGIDFFKDILIIWESFLSVFFLPYTYTMDVPICIYKYTYKIVRHHHMGTTVNNNKYTLHTVYSVYIFIYAVCIK